jgi:DUF971 family protein
VNRLEIVSISSARENGVLDVAWSDGRVQQLAHGWIRAQCRCAGCMSARLAGQAAPIPDDVRITHIQPVGSYGLQFVFSDGHERGIYPLALLEHWRLAP